MLSFNSYGTFVVGLLTVASSQVSAIIIKEDFNSLVRAQSTSTPSVKIEPADLENTIFATIPKTNQALPVPKNECEAALTAFMEMRTRIGNQKSDPSGFYAKFNEATQKEPVSSVKSLPDNEKFLLVPKLRALGKDSSGQNEVDVRSKAPGQSFKRPWLAAVFKDTVEGIQNDPDFVPELNSALQKTKILDVDLDPAKLNNISPTHDTTTISVKDENVIQTIQDILAQGKIPVVLNLGNERDPMGGAGSGCMAQEEELARCSTLSQINFPLAAAGYYPLSEFGAILTEDVTLVRDGSEKEYKPFLNSSSDKFDRSKKFVSVTSAAYNVNKKSGKSNVLVMEPQNPQANINDTLQKAQARIQGSSKKVLTQFQALQQYVENTNNKNIVFILGAFGCGAFDNDANEIVPIYEHYLAQFAGLVPEAIFAIKGITKSQNLSIFQELNGKTFEKMNGSRDILPDWNSIYNRAQQAKQMTMVQPYYPQNQNCVPVVNMPITPSSTGWTGAPPGIIVGTTGLGNAGVYQQNQNCVPVVNVPITPSSTGWTGAPPGIIVGTTGLGNAGVYQQNQNCVPVINVPITPSSTGWTGAPPGIIVGTTELGNAGVYQQNQNYQVNIQGSDGINSKLQQPNSYNITPNYSIGNMGNNINNYGMNPQQGNINFNGNSYNAGFPMGNMGNNTNIYGVNPQQGNINFNGNSYNAGFPMGNMGNNTNNYGMNQQQGNINFNGNSYNAGFPMGNMGNGNFSGTSHHNSNNVTPYYGNLGTGMSTLVTPLFPPMRGQSTGQFSNPYYYNPYQQ